MPKSDPRLVVDMVKLVLISRFFKLVVKELTVRGSCTGLVTVH